MVHGGALERSKRGWRPVLHASVVGLVTWLTAPGCTQRPPPDIEGDDDDDDTGAVDERLSYMPLVDGATWTYVHQSSSGQQSKPRSIRLAAVVDGEPGAFVRIEGEHDRIETTLRRHGGAVRAVLQRSFIGDTEIELVVFGDAGVPVVDDGWVDALGVVAEIRYLHETFAGTGEPTSSEWRTYRYEVLDAFEPITVPAGTFGCARIRRVRLIGASTGPAVDFWLARGVGVVKRFDVDAGELEVLQAVSVPQGVVQP